MSGLNIVRAAFSLVAALGGHVLFLFLVADRIAPGEDVTALGAIVIVTIFTGLMAVSIR